MKPTFVCLQTVELLRFPHSISVVHVVHTAVAMPHRSILYHGTHAHLVLGLRNLPFGIFQGGSGLCGVVGRHRSCQACICLVQSCNGFLHHVVVVGRRSLI